jgi:hypothetical protein
MKIQGWARIYKEKTPEEGGIFSFTHTIWIYETEWEADGKSKDEQATCLGKFPISLEINERERKLTFLPPSLVPARPSNGVDTKASTEDIPEVRRDSTEPGLHTGSDGSRGTGVEDG